MTTGDALESSLFEWIYSRNTEALEEFLQGSDRQSDKEKALSLMHRGQTPLTLALTLGYTDAVRLLLSAGASPLQRNAAGWSPFQEATSFGSREAMTLVFKARRSHFSSFFVKGGRGWRTLESLSQVTGNFCLEVEWSLRSAVPYLSNLCPSDTYTIYKYGSSVRIDATLIGFERLSWLRGRLSLLFHQGKLALVDHDRHVVQTIWPKDFKLSESDIEEEISMALNSPITSHPQIDIAGLNVTRAQSGLWSFKYDRTESVGPWSETQVWSLDGLTLSVKERKEHLEAYPLPHGAAPKNKHRSKGLSVVNPENRNSSDEEDETISTDSVDEEEEDEETRLANYKYGYRNVQDVPDPQEESQKAAQKAFKRLARYRPSLDPPPKHPLTLSEFLKPCSMRAECLHLGRPLLETTDTSVWQGTLWTASCPDTLLGTSSKDDRPDIVPLIKSLLPLSELLGFLPNGTETQTLFQSLTELFSIQLPPGLPVQLEIPLLSISLIACLRLKRLKKDWRVPKKSVENGHTNGDDGFFEIPGVHRGYQEGSIV